ncbi:hypothetical protein JTE90_022593 [Oedothorax gibbosus]|uniref:Uncharacterized protein n=1 Tax=Oedothorax gibbosus TaxID=931172 RepID=A0AAV6TE30_9ARAC|nr:hypothetical protein JTE90_022593 [Oedothorax gibbosus]
MSRTVMAEKNSSPTPPVAAAPGVDVAQERNKQSPHSKLTVNTLPKQTTANEGLWVRERTKNGRENKTHL